MAASLFSSLCLAVLFLCVCQTFGVNLRLDEPEERECHGTNVGFGYSGTLELHYQHLKRRYAGCTYIIGNLEITNLVDPKIDYDLSFLRNIRYVSGAVLIGLITEVEEIPLVNLEVIRGNSTYFLQGDHYSLVVVLTSKGLDDNFGLKELQMPQLKEISHGKVLLKSNPSLGYVDTVDWLPIMRGKEEDVHFMENACNFTVSNVTETPMCDHGTRWGQNPSMCQTVTYKECSDECDGRCFGPAPNQCCHASCAVGCSDKGEENCFMCKDYLYDNYCVGFCPAKSYPKNQNCVKYE
ncbi:epidermal growth factor receptor [Aplysia californica]|uniref:receptor protein-tyrosine kinase n=1 Tax=Aplysia californica TaxID=6500 RepID=A0ABM1A180_APLCA|nr:epidermal growth factor receptor [Aplysia californica]